MPSSAQLIKIWAAHGDGEGRGKGPILDFCDSESTACERSKGEGWWGGPGDVEEVPALLVDGEVWVLRQATPAQVLNYSQVRELKAGARGTTPEAEDEKLRNETLASLTQDQRRVLGLI